MFAGYIKGKVHFLLRDSSIKTATLKELDEEGKKAVQELLKAQKDAVKKKD